MHNHMESMYVDENRLENHGFTNHLLSVATNLHILHAQLYRHIANMRIAKDVILYCLHVR